MRPCSPTGAAATCALALAEALLVVSEDEDNVERLLAGRHGTGPVVLVATGRLSLALGDCTLAHARR